MGPGEKERSEQLGLDELIVDITSNWSHPFTFCVGKPEGYWPDSNRSTDP